MKPLPGGKVFADEFVLELDRAVPGVALQAVLLPGKLVGLVAVKVLLGLAAGGHVHVIERQDVRFEAAHLHWPGGGKRGDGLVRELGLDGFLRQEQQQAAGGRQVELDRDAGVEPGKGERLDLAGVEVPAFGAAQTWRAPRRWKGARCSC